jgi:hypothetical protein
MQPKHLLLTLFIAINIFSCKDKQPEENFEVYVEPKEVIEFGFDLNKYIVKRDTIRSGESFGAILARHNS